MKQGIGIYVQSNVIPDWFSNKVTAPLISLTMPTVHNKEYNFLGMVTWFVCHFRDALHWKHYSVNVAHEKSWFLWDCKDNIPDRHGELSCVYYFPYSNDEPFNGLKIKGGEQITVWDSTGGGIVKKIGIHLLYVNQHGNVTSFPAVVPTKIQYYYIRRS